MEHTNQDKLFVSTYNGPFLNSDSIVIEFEDVISSPELFFLSSIISAKADLSELVDVGELYSLENFEDIVDWYINRPCKELFGNFIGTDIVMENMRAEYPDVEDYDLMQIFGYTMMNDQLKNNKEFILNGMDLNFSSVLEELLKSELVKNVVIFSKFDNDVCEIIREKIRSITSKEFKVLPLPDYSSLAAALIKEEIPNNSTFIFADMCYISDVEEANLLERSSIILVDGYGYNVIDNEPAINITELTDKYTFKLDYFNNYYEED